ncbi:MAG TPA: Gfo/Idh/MocA family oxidoreductase [Candidatus Limnocylindria bacterium]|nr:Gfo/Idh/MocA family oxidoreductase [Candidatus Limnocylindria bacterium]
MHHESDLDRRSFVKGASFSGLMAMLGAIPLTAEEAAKAAGDNTFPPPKVDPNFKEKPVGPPVKFGIIGLGSHGREIITHLAKLPNAPVGAICDTYKSSVKRAADAAPNAKAYEDYKQLLDDKEVQAVVIATPTHLHKTIALDAMQAGKHVYLEAPIAHTIDDARTIAKAAQGLPAGRVFQAGLQYRENPQNHHVFKFIRTAAAGKPIATRGQWNKKTSWRRASPNSEREKALNWRLYKESSLGMFGELGIHSVDLASWYIGAMPLSITGFGGIIQWQDDREVADTIQAVVEFPNGVRHTYGATLAASFEGEHDVFFGSDASILIRDNRAWMFKEQDAPLLGWEVYARKDEFLTDSGIALVANATKILAQGKKPAEAASETDSPVRYALEKFVEHINDQTKPDANAEAAFRSVVMAVKGNEAITSGSKVTIDPALYQV